MENARLLRSRNPPPPAPRRIRRRIGRLPLLLAYLTVLFVFAIMAPSTASTGIRLEEVALYSILAVGVCALHLFANNEANWFRLDTLFLISFMIVNFQWPAMLLIDNIMPGQSTAYRVDKNLILRFEMYATYSSWLSALAITAWAAGYAITGNPRQRETSGWSFVRVLGLPLSRIVVLGLLAAFIVVAGPGYLLGDANATAREGGFVTLEGPAAYVQLILKTAMIVLIGAEFFALITRKHGGGAVTLGSFATNPGLLIAILFTAAFYLAGERGEMVQVFALVGILYGMHFRPFRAHEFLLTVIGGALLFTLIGHTRAHGWAEIDTFLDGFNPWRATVNLANSSICLLVAIEVTELRGTYYWGQLFISNILALIPFAQGIFNATFGTSTFDLNSAFMMAAHLYGPNPHTGPGTSITADAYINFGAIGLVAILFIYGLACRFFSDLLRNPTSIFSFSAACAFASLIFYAGRGSVFNQLQPVVWSFALAMLLYRAHRVPSRFPPK